MEKYKKIMKLNLPEYDYSLFKKNERLYIVDILRRKKLILTPEEWVRQHFINFLIVEKKVPKNLLVSESGLKYNSLNKRTDIMAYSKSGKVLLLVECKAGYVGISEKTVFQLSVYNSRIDAAFLAVSNGMEHHYWKKSENREYIKLAELPDFNEMESFIG